MHSQTFGEELDPVMALTPDPETCKRFQQSSTTFLAKVLILSFWFWVHVCVLTVFLELIWALSKVPTPWPPVSGVFYTSLARSAEAHVQLGVDDVECAIILLLLERVMQFHKPRSSRASWYSSICIGFKLILRLIIITLSWAEPGLAVVMWAWSWRGTRRKLRH